MKKTLILTLIAVFFIAVGAAGAKEVEAISIYTPFGDKVLLNPVPDILCGIPPAMNAPMSIRSGISPTGLWLIILPTTITYSYRVFFTGAWTLGLYLTTPLPCYTATTPPIPVPQVAYPIFSIGTSLLPF